MKKRFWIIFVVIAASFTISGTALAITNGQPDGDGHPFVGLILDSGFNPLCTGTAIDSQTVVTAAHCFSEYGELVWVNFDSEISINVIPGIAYPHPEFCPLCGPGLKGTDTHDIAVIKLHFPAPLSEFAELPEAGYVSSLPQKGPLTIVGYGIQGWVKGKGLKPKTVPIVDGKRYAAVSSLIQSKHVNHDEYIKISANPSKGKGGVCFGDSGGPNLYGENNLLIAINSFNNNINCSGVTYSNRLDLEYAIDFISNFMEN
jgi:secreted trypsin-like serine protease